MTQTSPESAEQLWDEYCDQLEWEPSAQGAISFAFARMSGVAQTPAARAIELLEERPAAALRALVIEECAKIAESYPSSGKQTEHPVEYWIRRLSDTSTDRTSK